MAKRTKPNTTETATPATETPTPAAAPAAPTAAEVPTAETPVTSADPAAQPAPPTDAPPATAEAPGDGTAEASPQTDRVPGETVESLKEEIRSLRAQFDASYGELQRERDELRQAVAPRNHGPAEIDLVLADLPDIKPVGHVSTNPTPHLTGRQGEVQNRLYLAIANRGVALRDQGQVYAWLLDQIEKAVGPDGD